MPRTAFLLLLALALVVGGALEGHAAKRVALVIGNSAYQSVDNLANPANDAAAIAKSLNRLGFTSIVHKSDLDYRDFRRALSEFSRLADGADVAMIYYAGHGIEVDKRNYLIPVDAQLRDARDVDLEALPLDVVMTTLEGARKLRLVVLDACRNNPFRARMTRTGGSRSVGRGFTRVDAASNTLVAYAAKEGTTADDGTGNHSPYAAALLRHLETPGLEINFLFRRVRDSVLSSTGGRQEPFVYGSLSSEAIYLKPPAKETKDSPLVNMAPVSPAVQAWGVVKDTNRASDLEAFIKRFPDSFYTDLARSRLKTLKEKKVAVGRPPQSPGLEPDPRRPAALPKAQPDGPPPPVLPAKRKAAARGTLRSVLKRGKLYCGVNKGLAGWSAPNSSGAWGGLDVDYCRAVSAAIFGHPNKVKYVPLSAKERFTALQSGEIDVLARNTTRTVTRETQLGLSFVGVNYYDGQGFIIRKKLGVSSALELDGAAACIMVGTTSELNLANYFRANRMSYDPVSSDTWSEAVRAYDAERCDVLTGDASGLAQQRLSLTNPNDHKILPELLNTSSIGPWVRQGDAQWLNLLRWTLHAMIKAEELGVSSQNVESMARSGGWEIAHLLGSKGDIGPRLGVGKRWAYNIIEHVGNYGESFARNLGDKSSFKISRGLNSLRPNGGLMFAPDLR